MDGRLNLNVAVVDLWPGCSGPSAAWSEVEVACCFVPENKPCPSVARKAGHYGLSFSFSLQSQ